MQAQKICHLIYHALPEGHRALIDGAGQHEPERSNCTSSVERSRCLSLAAVVASIRPDELRKSAILNLTDAKAARRLQADYRQAPPDRPLMAIAPFSTKN